MYWRCRRAEGDDVTVKSTWAKAGPSPTEGDRFRNAYVDGIPDLICEESVFRARDQPWSTMWVRDTLEGQERMSVIGRIRQLELRRLVFDMASRPLKEFESKGELIQALRDTLHGMSHSGSLAYVTDLRISAQTPIQFVPHPPVQHQRHDHHAAPAAKQIATVGNVGRSQSR